MIAGQVVGVDEAQALLAERDRAGPFGSQRLALAEQRGLVVLPVRLELRDGALRLAARGLGFLELSHDGKFPILQLKRAPAEGVHLLLQVVHLLRRHECSRIQLRFFALAFGARVLHLAIDLLAPALELRNPGFGVAKRLAGGDKLGSFSEPASNGRKLGVDPVNGEVLFLQFEEPSSSSHRLVLNAL